MKKQRTIILMVICSMLLISCGNGNDTGSNSSPSNTTVSSNSSFAETSSTIFEDDSIKLENTSLVADEWTEPLTEYIIDSVSYSIPTAFGSPGIFKTDFGSTNYIYNLNSGVILVSRFEENIDFTEEKAVEIIKDLCKDKNINIVKYKIINSVLNFTYTYNEDGSTYYSHAICINTNKNHILFSVSSLISDDESDKLLAKIEEYSSFGSKSVDSKNTETKSLYIQNTVIKEEQIKDTPDYPKQKYHSNAGYIEFNDGDEYNYGDYGKCITSRDLIGTNVFIMVKHYTVNDFLFVKNEYPFATCKTIDNGNWLITFDNFSRSKSPFDSTSKLKQNSHIESKNFVLCGKYIGISKEYNIPILKVDIIHDCNLRYAAALYADDVYNPKLGYNDRKTAGIQFEPFKSYTLRKEEDLFEKILVNKPTKEEINNNKVIRINYYEDKNSDSSDSQSSQSSTKDNPTLGEKSAVSQAISYLNYTSFSRKSLIEQLEYEGFTHDEAVYGADNSGANWKEQAAKKAKSYLDLMSMSRSELKGQLEYEGFTSEQISYGLSSVGY